MSLQSKTQEEANIWTLEIKIDAATFKEANLKAYQKQKNRINVPGFRRGKAPMPLLLQYYGKDVFYEDALEAVYPKAIEEAYAESGIEPVCSPYDMDVKEIGEDGVLFAVKAAVKPEVELTFYKGLEAEKRDVTVDAEEITREMERLRERNSRITSVERPAQDGDISVIDFEGFVDEVAFPGGKGEQYELTLGSGQFIPGFEEQIIGHSVGDAFDVNVTFPAEYAPELAGKDAVFRVKLHEVKHKELPEMDDEFAKDLGEYETVEDLKKGIEEDSRKRKQDEEDKRFENNVMQKLCEQLVAEIPAPMLQTRANDNIEQFAQRLRAQKMDIDTYLGYMGMDRAQYEAQMLDQATQQVKTDLALEKVAALEGLEPAEEEIAAQYEKLAQQYSMEIDKLKEVLSEKLVKEDLQKEAAMKFVVDNAKAVAPQEAAEGETAGEEKPVKKAAAKKPATKKAKDADAAEEAEATEKKPAKKPAAKKTPAKKADDAEKAADSAE